VTLGGGRRCAAIVLAAAIVSAAACDNSPSYHVEVAEPAPPVTRTLAVGTHRVTLTLPAKWRHDDREGTHHFRRSIGALSVSDLGPVTPRGLFDAITRAHNAFLDGRLEDAQTILATFDLRHTLDDEESRREYENRWRKLRQGRPRDALDNDEVNAAYTDVLSWIFHFPDPAAAEVFDDAMELIRHDDELREVLSTQGRTIDGREGRLVETWNRRSHDHRQAHLFVLDKGYLLVAQMEMGKFEALEPEFAMLIDSLKLGSRSR
jgi:hypothetical protein